MKRKPQKYDFRMPRLPEDERGLLNNALTSLQRIAADPAYATLITDLQTVVMLWTFEVLRREELQELAEIGQRVRDAKKRDELKTLVAHKAVRAQAELLIQQGYKRRGLAARMEKLPAIGLSKRQINRILKG